MSDPKNDADTDDVPVGATGKAAEYLDKLITDSYKRELDQEENVVRSLPFFATSIGVLLTFVGFTRGSLPPMSWQPWPVLAYGLLVGLLLCLVALIFLLYQAVRLRRFDVPMSERALIDYAGALTAFYRDAPPAAREALGGEAAPDPAEGLEQAVVDDIRKAILDQYATAAAKSRANNTARLKARGRAFTLLMMALGFAMALIGAMIVEVALAGGDHGRDGDARASAAQHQDGARPEDGGVSKKADAAGDAGDGKGGVDLSRGGVARE